MEMVFDIVTLVLVAYMVVAIPRSKHHVCPHCAAYSGSAHPPEERVVPLQTSRVMDVAPLLRSAASAVAPESDASLSATPGETGRPEGSLQASGEIVIDTEGELFGLLSDADQDPAATVVDDDVLLDEDIGLGVMGVPMTLPLIQAGFAITSLSHPWGNGRQRHVPEPPGSRAEDIATLEMELETLEVEKAHVAPRRDDRQTRSPDRIPNEGQGSDEDIVLGPRGITMATHLQQAGFTVRTSVPKALLTPEEREELERQGGAQ